MSEPIWTGTNGHNFDPGRGGQTPQLIVNHIMLGTLDGSTEHFATPDAQASSTYGLGRDGEIRQFVRETDTPYTNGPIRDPNSGVVPLIAWCQAHYVNPNRLTISVEWEGMHSNMHWTTQLWHGQALPTLARTPAPTFWVPSPAQMAAGIALIREIAARWKIPVDRAHICRHSDFDTITRWFCPGAGFDLQQIIEALGGHV